MKRVLEAIVALKQGKPIIIVDNKDREYEGDLVAASESVLDETINFMVLHSSGVICLALLEEQLKKLKIPMMQSQEHSRDKFETAFTYSIEASSGVTTGISAKDRAHTIRVASNPEAKSSDVISPGHIFPLKAREGLLDERKGHTEASIEMCLLAGLNPSAAIVEVADNLGGMLKGEALEIFAKTYRVPLVSIEEIITYKGSEVHYVEKYSESSLPTEFGDFKISVWKDIKGEELVVMSKGILSGEDVPIRLHSKCITGDVFHSKKCDCKQQLHDSLKYINEKGYGMVLYLDQEGRGLSIADKIKAYSFQDKGLDTIEANIAINQPVDNRKWDFAQNVLKEYKLKSVELLTNNPDKIKALRALYGDSVKVKTIPTIINKYNKKYIETKIHKMNHKIEI